MKSEIRILSHFDDNQYYQSMAVTAIDEEQAADIRQWLKERNYGIECQNGNILVVKIYPARGCSMKDLEQIMRDFCQAHELSLCAA